MRRREEFYCTECHKYFLTYLRDNMSGDYTIECPNEKCKHHHYRKIKEGLVTQDRHQKTREGDSEIILGLVSTLRETPWHDDPSFKRSLIRQVAHLLT